MRTFTCNRCHDVKPIRGSRRRKLWGGRICEDCEEETSRYFRRGSGDVVSPPRRRAVSYEDAPARPSMLKRLANAARTIFRRRGVQ